MGTRRGIGRNALILLAAAFAGCRGGASGPVGKWAYAMRGHFGPPENPNTGVFVRVTSRIPDLIVDIQPNSILTWRLPQVVQATWTMHGSKIEYRVQSVNGYSLKSLTIHLPLAPKVLARLSKPFYLEMMKDGRMRGEFPNFPSPPPAIPPATSTPKRGKTSR